MRLFIAVPVPGGLKKKIAELQDEIRKAGTDAKFVEAENLHFTIKFLGEVEEGKIPEIRKALERACANFSAFDIDVAGISAFPSRNYARAVWLSVREGFREFESLIKNIDEELSKIGYEKDRNHIPHLTLARVRSGRNKAELLKLLEIMEKREIGKMKVDEIKLMKSILSRAGPVYGEVYSVKLR